MATRDGVALIRESALRQIAESMQRIQEACAPLIQSGDPLGFDIQREVRGVLAALAPVID